MFNHCHIPPAGTIPDLLGVEWDVRHYLLTQCSLFIAIAACLSCIAAVCRGKGSPTVLRNVGASAELQFLRQIACRGLNHRPNSGLPLLSARTTVTFPASEHHRPSRYCVVIGGTCVNFFARVTPWQQNCHVVMWNCVHGTCSAYIVNMINCLSHGSLCVHSMVNCPWFDDTDMFFMVPVLSVVYCITLC